MTEPLKIVDKIDIPQSAYASDKAMAEFIVILKEKLGDTRKLEKVLKVAIEEASGILLDSLESTGQKHFAFDDLGTFSKKTTVNRSFPSQADGGREAAVEWLDLLRTKGLIDLQDMLNVQQSRIAVDPLKAIEKIANDYNAKLLEQDPNAELIPDSPFGSYEKVSLSSPTKRKVRT